MARNYKPSMPFNVAMRLLTPIETNVKGTLKKTFTNDPEADGTLFYGSFRTFGGTESTSNDLYTVIDTATIDTWYSPDICADCRVYIESTGETYDILGTPENINMRNQYLQIKVRKVGGGA